MVRGHVVARLSTELESVDLEAEEYLAREREASLHTRPHVRLIDTQRDIRRGERK